jgi:Protein of unknown function (DUF3379)
MNQHEARFLLRAFRPSSTDAKDPVFADALAEAEKDPTLKAWLDNESAFDRAMGAKLREIQPPAGLREAILAGSRVSQKPKARWKNPVWLAVAASIAITCAITLRFRPSGPSAQDFAEYAMHELATTHNSDHSRRPELTGLQALLTRSSLPLPGNIKINADELRRLGCRTVSFAGHDAFEICFERGGNWYHLYAMRVEDFSRGAADAKSLMTTKGHFTATAWKDAQFAYALVTYDGPDALRRLI